MSRYEIQLADGRTVAMSGQTPEHACARAADLWQAPVVAWRPERYVIAPVHYSQIIG